MRHVNVKTKICHQRQQPERVLFSVVFEMKGLEWIYTNSTTQDNVLINKRDIKKQGLGDRVDIMGQLQIIVSSTKTDRIL